MKRDFDSLCHERGLVFTQKRELQKALLRVVNHSVATDTFDAERREQVLGLFEALELRECGSAQAGSANRATAAPGPHSGGVKVSRRFTPQDRRWHLRFATSVNFR